jgi:hypothetical protein
MNGIVPPACEKMKRMSGKRAAVHHHVSPPGFINALIKHQAGERPMLDVDDARRAATQ